MRTLAGNFIPTVNFTCASLCYLKPYKHGHDALGHGNTLALLKKMINSQRSLQLSSK